MLIFVSMETLFAEWKENNPYTHSLPTPNPKILKGTTALLIHHFKSNWNAAIVVQILSKTVDLEKVIGKHVTFTIYF